MMISTATRRGWVSGLLALGLVRLVAPADGAAESRGFPDLVPQISAPPTALVGRDMGGDILLTIENLGDGTAPAGFTVEIGLFMSPAEGPGMYRMLTRFTSPYPLPPHQQRRYAVIGAVIPEHFQWGTNHYRLCARIDPANHLRQAGNSPHMACTEVQAVSAQD